MFTKNQKYMLVFSLLGQIYLYIPKRKYIKEGIQNRVTETLVCCGSKFQQGEVLSVCVSPPSGGV